MNDYEFWNELGKIFNAVVAYQEKAVEFNKRFINPWIRLGNVFDKQDRNQEAICTYKKALELDPANAQNWYELGNLYFRAKDYDEAVEAYNKSIEFAPEGGWSYNNLALTMVSQGKYSEALPLYQKGVDLIQDDKDKAVVWNRIGNVYRKLNLYDLAVEAFQKADELDAENAGFHDELDDVPDGAASSPSDGGEMQEQDQDQEGSSVQSVSPIQLILSESQLEDAASAETDAPPDPAAPPEATAPEPPAPADATPGVGPTVAESALTQSESTEDAAVSAEQPVKDEDAEPAVQAADPTPAQADQQPAAGEEQVTTVVRQEVGETYTEIPTTVNVTTTETTTVVVTAEPVTNSEPPAPVEEIPSADVTTAQTPEVEAIQVSTLSIEETNVDVPAEAPASAATTEPGSAGSADESAIAEIELEIEDQQEPAGDLPAVDQLAYDEFLKDNDDLVLKVDEQPTDALPEALKEPAAMVDASGELQIEMDTKNAHVWNELGNIYFNTGAFDDAIVAYSKAIQLDRWFAWPYSNLALTYVQKGRFTEAILLYQRSIELFTSEKDKAISWNRLGNVYRRLNNYDGAISAYQRADELDPENTTLSLQSRFSLLGNYSAEQVPSPASQAEEMS